MVAKDLIDTKGLTALEDLPPTDDKRNEHHDHKGGTTSVRLHLKHTSTKGGFSFWRALHHVHRLAIFVVAVIYIVTLLGATARTFDLLYGVALSPDPKPASTAKLMAAAIGNTTLRESPLVKTMLHDDTSPRNGTIFLNASGHSTTPCKLSPMMARIYSDAHMRTTYAALTAGASYNLTFLDPNAIELIAPVVDCTTRIIVLGYNTVVNYFFLVRSRSNRDDVSMLRMMMGNQDYRTPGQTGEGPAALATITFANDLRVPNIEQHVAVSMGYPFEKYNFRAGTLLGMTEFGLWRVRVIPATDHKEIAKTIETATRSGFFIKAETEQSNVNTHVWVLPTAPIEAMVTTQWRNKPGLRDSWAWVHLLHLLLAITMVANIVILIVIMYEKLRQGQLWIGDAFVSVYNTLHMRGAFVLFSWYMNEFWSVYEFCLSDANTFTYIESITVFPVVTEADLRSIYISLSGVLGILFRVRVDPLVVFASFEVAYVNRRKILLWFPSLVADAGAHALMMYSHGSATKNPFQPLVAPTFFWTTAHLSERSVAFIFTMLLPIILGLVVVLAYIVVRRIYRRFRPDPIRVLHSRNTATSGNEDTLRQLQSKLTFFELATGAELNNRFGFLAEYDNAVFIKGVKFASADGIYSNGFVLANGKFLLQTQDFWPIVLMKLVRVRYKNVFVYEIEGSTVKQTARLVYPQTFAWTDLFHLDVTNLS